jgi:iron complex outermembrane receptor protein
MAKKSEAVWSAVAVALAAAATVTCRDVSADEGPDNDAPADSGITTLQEVIVTGTRQTTRTVAESLAPIDVLSAADMTKSGKQSTRDLIATLVPSISTSNSGAGASFAIKTIGLRGLSGDETLVLVNGKRRHDTAVLFINGTTQNGQSPPDVDLIPVSSIERIEVLRDGAAAQYGSDAIAGVINIILKSNSSGGGATAEYGQTGAGDGETSQISPDIGFALGDGGHLHLSADAKLQQRTDRGTANTSVLYFPINGQPDPREATADRDVNHPGQPHVRSAELAYDLGLPLGDKITFYSFTTGAIRDSDSWLTYRNPNASNNNVAVYPDGYVPKLLLRDIDYQAAVGVKGTDFYGINWDFSSTFGRDEVGYSETTSLNASLGPASPTDFYIGSLASSEWTTNLDLSRDFNLGLAAGPLFGAAGLEYRRNRYTIGVGEPDSYINGSYVAPSGPLKGVKTIPGSQGVTGFPPDAAGTSSRSDYGAYLNFEQHLTHDWEVALAGRYEDYSDAGSTSTGKFSTRYEPFDGYAIRGTISTGFRAPTLAQEHYASSSTIGVSLTPGAPLVLYPVRTLPVDSPAAIALGAKPLVPEKSTSYSVGFVLQPVPLLNVTLDLYDIKIKDRILLTGSLLGTAVSNALAANGLDPNQGGLYFTNAADTTTRGVDLVTTYRTDFGAAGRVDWSFSGNYNKTTFDRVEKPPPQLAAAGLVLIDRGREGDFTEGTPRDKYILDADWNIWRFETNIRATRYGKTVQVSPSNPALDDPITPKVIVDLDVAYRITDHALVAVGANDLFNTYPNILKPANQGVTGFSYYNPYSPYGISGGFYYIRLSYQY